MSNAPPFPALLADQVDFRFEYLSPSLLRGVYEHGFERPSPIQRLAIPRMLRGQSLVAQAHAGSGKTGAFAAALLSLLDPHRSSLQGIIVSPSKDLAEQSFYTTQAIGTHSGAKGLCLTGENHHQEVSQLKKGVHFVSTTPGKLRAVANHGSVKHLRCIVLDEADKLTEDVFWGDILRFLGAVRDSGATPVVGFFAATVTGECERRISAQFPGIQQIRLSQSDVSATSLDHYFIPVGFQYAEDVIDCSVKAGAEGGREKDRSRGSEKRGGRTASGGRGAVDSDGQEAGAPGGSDEPGGPAAADGEGGATAGEPAAGAPRTGPRLGGGTFRLQTLKANEGDSGDSDDGDSAIALAPRATVSSRRKPGKPRKGANVELGEAFQKKRGGGRKGAMKKFSMQNFEDELDNGAPRLAAGERPDGQQEKLAALVSIYDSISAPQSIVFCNSKAATDLVYREMRRSGMACGCVSAAVAPRDRELTLQRFREGKLRALVATDVLARGIDVRQVSLVVNFDVPLEGEAYLHRTGRASRYGRHGTAVTLVTRRELDLLLEHARAYSLVLRKLGEV